MKSLIEKIHMECQCKMNEIFICIQYQVWEIKEKTLPSFSILQTGVQLTLGIFPPIWVSI